LTRRAARKTRLHPGFNPRAWVTRHLQVALGSLGSLRRAPSGTLMTVAVIGIALALPSGLLVLLGNLQQIVAEWEGPATITLFLRADLSDAQSLELAQRIEDDPQTEKIQVIGRDEALAEFRSYSGFGDAIDALEENPLPPVILVSPGPQGRDPNAAAALSQRLDRLPEVELAQLDLEWVQRLQGIAEIARRGAHLIAALLALAVLLIIGNTIRLEIQNRHDEIAITKLVGATDAFVRRPFLYHGAWLGLLGGLTAWFLVAGALALLADPVTRLAELYHSGFRLAGPSPLDILALLGGGAAIGWLGAWVSVGRHLTAVEPE
jgi:cell division transport system permease protein